MSSLARVRPSGYNFKGFFGLGGGGAANPQGGGGSMQPGFDNGNNQPNTKPINPGTDIIDPMKDPRINPPPKSPEEEARTNRIYAENQRVKDLSDEERASLRRSEYAQNPNSVTAANYMKETGVDPTVFLRADPYTAQRRLDEQYAAAGAFNPKLDMRDAANSREAQMSLAQMLQQRAAGQGSVAAEMLRMQGERSAEQALANARAGSAYNPGMAQMLGERAAFEARGQASDQARIAALQEQEQAQGMLGGLYGQMRGQDIQSSGMGSQLQLQAEEMRRQGQMAALGMKADLSEADRQALMQREQLVNRFALGNEEIQAANSRAAADRWWRLGAGVAQGISEGIARRS